jgi:hypothetical protein
VKFGPHQVKLREESVNRLKSDPVRHDEQIESSRPAIPISQKANEAPSVRPDGASLRERARPGSRGLTDASQPSRPNSVESEPHDPDPPPDLCGRTRASGPVDRVGYVRTVNQPGDIVRAFFECMEARDWAGAGRHLSPTVHIEYTETGERFDGDNFLAMNRAYPDGWTIAVEETIADGDRVAAQVRVTHGDDTFWCAGFYRVADGVIVSGVEHWVNERSQPAPAWRQQFVT